MSLSLVTYPPLFKVSPERSLRRPSSARTCLFSDTFLVPYPALLPTFTPPLTTTMLRTRVSPPIDCDELGVPSTTGWVSHPIWPRPTAQGHYRCGRRHPKDRCVRLTWFHSRRRLHQLFPSSVATKRAAPASQHLTLRLALSKIAPRESVGRGGRGGRKGRRERWWYECVGCESVEPGCSPCAPRRFVQIVSPTKPEIRTTSDKHSIFDQPDGGL